MQRVRVSQLALCPAGATQATDTEEEGLHLAYDVTGNRTRLRDRGAEIHYRFDDADELVAAEESGDRRVVYRSSTSACGPARRLIRTTCGSYSYRPGRQAR